MRRSSDSTLANYESQLHTLSSKVTSSILRKNLNSNAMPICENGKKDEMKYCKFSLDNSGFTATERCKACITAPALLIGMSIFSSCIPSVFIVYINELIKVACFLKQYPEFTCIISVELQFYMKVFIYNCKNLHTFTQESVIYYIQCYHYWFKSACKISSHLKNQQRIENFSSIAVLSLLKIFNRSSYCTLKLLIDVNKCSFSVYVKM